MALMKLPPDFVEIGNIDETKEKKFVNVVGIVKDCRLPIPTHGTGESTVINPCF
jgi:hypothetical protein